MLALVGYAGCGKEGTITGDASASSDTDATFLPDAAPVAVGTGLCSGAQIVYFVAEPSTIVSGQASTLSWRSLARICYLQPGDIIPPSEVYQVSPTVTTTYTLRCALTACLVDQGEDRAATANVTVTVR